MQLSRCLVLAQLVVLATCQDGTPKNGLELYLKSAMKEFPDWIKSTGGGDLFSEAHTINISQHAGFVGLDGEIGNLSLKGDMEYYPSVREDFVDNNTTRDMYIYRNLEIVGNYSASGSLYNKSVSGQGVFKLKQSNFSFVGTSKFSVTVDGRMNRTTAEAHTYMYFFDDSLPLPEIKGRHSKLYSRYMAYLIQSLVARQFQQFLGDRIEDYIEGVLESAPLATILTGNYYDYSYGDTNATELTE